MTKKVKELISKHFTIGSVIWEEAIQCAMITAEYLNDAELIKELNEIKEKEIIPKSPLYKYWMPKQKEEVAKQIELFL
jgi:hypothetical protein